MKKILNFLIFILMVFSILAPVITAKSTNQKNIFLKKERGPLMKKIISFLRNISFIDIILDYIKNFFGLVEDTPNIDDEESYYDLFYTNINEPSKENPTDTSISVNIKNFDINYETENKRYDFEIVFNGETTGDVYVCYYVVVAYFTDGTNTYYHTWTGPTEQPEKHFDDITIGLTFYGTGPGGKTDWSKFKGRQYSSGVLYDEVDIPVEIPDYQSEKNLKDYRLYVRAFSDKELTKWNQDSISLFDELSSTNNKKSDKKNNDDDKKSIPGFELSILIVAIGVALIILRRRN